jgi:Tfp pilus assembly protein FimT
MGILFGIATSTWFGVVESRRVDSATNQVVSDLRLAHTSATNRLMSWQVVVPLGGGPSYQIGVTGDLRPRTLPEGTELAGGTTLVEFSPDGSAQITGSGNIVVRAEDDLPSNDIAINPVTSRVRVD